MSNITDPLSALVSIISTQTATLQAAYSNGSTDVPSIDTPFQPGPLEFDPELAEARRLIVAAATQLIATVQSPAEVLQHATTGVFNTATLGFVVDVNIPEILNEAGPKGLQVKEISAASGVEASYIARVLRYLATRHIFREVSPNVFAHNRNSTFLTKSKSLQEINADPIARFDDAPLASFLHSSGDELIASVAQLTSFIKNPALGGASAAPFNMAYKTTKKMWDWYEEPGNEWRARRFTAAMKGGAETMYPAEIFTSAIEGASLSADSVVVDVGGSVGHVVLMLRKAYPHLRYVVQDLPQQVVAGEKFWNEKDPQALKSGMVKLQAHDFLTPEPVKNAAIYFLRMIIHDWPDKESKTILSQIRSAAGVNSKLVIFDALAQYTTGEDPGMLNTVQTTSKPQYPLLGNLGVAGAGWFTALDMALLTMYNGKERTLDEFSQLGEESGWKLESVKRGKLAALTFSAI